MKGQKGSEGLQTRQPVPSIILLNEQRTDTGHRLILVNGDTGLSGGWQKINAQDI